MAKDFISDTEMFQLEKQGVAKPVASAPDFISDAEADKILNPRNFRYDVPAPAEDKKAKIARLEAEAATAAKEAKKTGSAWGIFKNTVKGTGETLLNSEIGLGKTIAKTMDKTTLNTATKNIETLTQSQASLLKQMKERKAKGLDTKNLELAYNKNADLIEENRKSIGDFETSIPTNKQAMGQIGGTALDLLTAGSYNGVGAQSKAALKATTQLKNPITAARALETGLKTGQLGSKAASTATKVATATGLPELSKIGSHKASGLLTKKGIGNVLKGAGIGYASDVTQGLQGARGEDREGAKAFIPGLGTAIGTAIPAITEGAQSVRNMRDPEIKALKLVEKRHKELDKLDGLQTLKKAVDKGKERGIDVKKVLAETDVLHDAVDKTGKITTKGEGQAADVYRKLYVDDIENVVSESLKKEGKSISPDKIALKLRKTILNSGIEGAELDKALGKLDREMAGYTRRAGQSGVIPTYVLHDAKVDKYSNINFFTDPAKQKYDKAIARGLKELVEENTSSIDVQAANKELSKHFAVLDYLEKMDGRVVRGGKLGRYFSSIIGTGVGGSLGSAIGGPFGGAAGAAAGAELGARMKGNQMSKVFQGKTGKIAPQAEAIINAQDYIKKPPLQLPASGQNTSSSLNNLGNRQINQATTTTPKIKGISTIIPDEKGSIPVKSLLTGAVTGTGIAAGAFGLANLKKDQKAPEPKIEVIEELTPREDGSKVYKLQSGTEVGELHPTIKSSIKEAYKAYPSVPKGVLEALIMKESSGGYDNSNKNSEIGKFAWLGGLTQIAKKELQRLGYKPDFNTIGGTINSIAKFWELKAKEGMTPLEVYNKEYSSGKLSKEDLQKFQDMLGYYSRATNIAVNR